jgi:hypothetical protein
MSYGRSSDGQSYSLSLHDPMTCGPYDQFSPGGNWERIEVYMWC